jgi:hypothetical protein
MGVHVEVNGTIKKTLIQLDIREGYQRLRIMELCYAEMNRQDDLDKGVFNLRVVLF